MTTRVYPHSIEAERALLGQCILDEEVLTDVGRLVSPEDFYRGDHARLFALLQDMASRGPVDSILLMERVLAEGEEATPYGGLTYVLELPDHAPTTTNSAHYAEIIREHSQRREAIEALEGAVEAAHDREAPVADLVDDAVARVSAVGEKHTREDEGWVCDVIEDIDAESANAAEEGHDALPIPRDRVSELIDVQPGKMIVIMGLTGHGKAGEISEPILTPLGWSTYGDIRVGDEVISVDGTATKVLGVFPQGVRDLAEVELSCGTVCRVDWDHLWEVQTDGQVCQGSPSKVLSTREIAERVKDGSRYRYRVPLVAPVQHPEAVLPVEPYTLGVLLGDGNLAAGVLFYSPDSEIIALVRDRLPIGHSLTERDAPGCVRCSVRGVGYIGGSNAGANDVLNGLRALGVMGMRSYEKHIPPEYLIASVEQRLELLRGLMDTDGGVEQGYPVFSSSSPDLAQGVRDLVHSLGGSTRGSNKIPHFTYRGERKTGRRSYTVRVNLPAEINPFHLSRKREAVSITWAPRRKIVAVRPAGEAECVCIAVEHPRQLYVTTGYIVTHNTSFALDWLTHFSDQDVQIPCGFVSLEMHRKELLRRQLASLSGVGAYKHRKGWMTPADWTAWNAAAERIADAPVRYIDRSGLTIDDVRARAYRLHRQLQRLGWPGLRCLFIDYLQRLRPTDPRMPRSQAVAEMSAGCKDLAQELQIPVVVLAQPNRMSLGEVDKRPKLHHLKDSGSIEQDADIVLGCYYHARTMPDAEAKKDHWPHYYEVEVLKNRGGGLGRAILHFTPELTRFRDLTVEEFREWEGPEQAARTAREEKRAAKAAGGS